jgi:glycosyltransferase involved in cell wall biosynthesis
MYKNKTVGVIVPAYNEEKLIGKVLETMPKFVDRIIVINDASKDLTLTVIQGFKQKDPRIHVINHEINKGLGQSLIDGYLYARESNIEVTAVMAGDAQMFSGDLENVINPIVEERADYIKGNRLLHEDVIERMPKYRYIGNSILTLLTKFATGYWHVIDPQCGYTAIGKKALSRIPIEKMTKGYGYNADILNMLNLNNCKVGDVEVVPVYGEELSKIKLSSYIPKVSFLLVKLFIKRLFYKYFVREFHPLIFFYIFSFLNLLFLAPPLMTRFFYLYLSLGIAPTTTLILLTYSIMMGFFSLFFAMWMDMENNKELKVSRI